MSEDGGFDAHIELGVALTVHDVDRALDFYIDVLGFQFVGEEDPHGDRRIATVRYGNTLVDLVAGEGGERRQAHRLFWTVDDLAAALDHLRAGGGSIVRQLEYGTFCADPDGNGILVRARDLGPEEAQDLFF